jgi:hypothetical protein
MKYKVIPILKEALLHNKTDENLRWIAQQDLEVQKDTLEFYQRNGTVNRPTSAVKAVRVFCKACVGGSLQRVKECDVTMCALHDFRYKGANE